MGEETKFDQKIDAAVDSGAGVVKDVAKDVNHLTDDVAKAVVDLAKGVGKVAEDIAKDIASAVGGKPAKHNPDVDPTTKMGK